jgi:hypothetical protein
MMPTSKREIINIHDRSLNIYSRWRIVLAWGQGSSDDGWSTGKKWCTWYSLRVTLLILGMFPKSEIINIRDRSLNIYPPSWIAWGRRMAWGRIAWGRGLTDDGCSTGKNEYNLNGKFWFEPSWTHKFCDALDITCEWPCWFWRWPCLSVKSLISVTDHWTYTHAGKLCRLGGGLL